MKNNLILFILISFFCILFFNSCTKTEIEQVNPTSLDQNASARIGDGSITNAPQCPAGKEWSNVLKTCVPKCPAGAIRDIETGECIYVPTPSPCQAVSTNTINQTYRNKAVASYGINGGINYDRFRSYTTGRNIDAVLFSYNWTVHNHSTQIQNAIIQGSNAYGASVSPTTAYNAEAYLRFLEIY